MKTRRRPGLQGTSLVEVLVASAILAGVLVSTLDLSVRAGRVLVAARQRTQVNALGNEIMETIRDLHFRHCWELIETDPDRSERVLSWDSEEDAVNGEKSEILAHWSERVEELPEGRLILQVRGLAGLGQPARTRPLVQAAVLHVSVCILWREPGRKRELILQTFRT